MDGLQNWLKSTTKLVLRTSVGPARATEYKIKAIREDERESSVLESCMCHFELPEAGQGSGNLWMEGDEGFVF